MWTETTPSGGTGRLTGLRVGGSRDTKVLRHPEVTHVLLSSSGPEARPRPQKLRDTVVVPVIIDGGFTGHPDSPRTRQGMGVKPGSGTVRGVTPTTPLYGDSHLHCFGVTAVEDPPTPWDGASLRRVDLPSSSRRVGGRGRGPRASCDGLRGGLSPRLRMRGVVHLPLRSPVAGGRGPKPVHQPRRNSPSIPSSLPRSPTGCPTLIATSL